MRVHEMNLENQRLKWLISRKINTSYLDDFLKDSDWRIRQTAVDRIGDQAKIKSMINDESIYVKIAAIVRLNDTETIKHIIFNETDEWVKDVARSRYKTLMDIDI